jgi:hypothetical protein
MPLDKQSIQRLLQRAQARQITQSVIPLAITPKAKNDALNDFQKAANKMTGSSEVVLIAVSVTK